MRLAPRNLNDEARAAQRAYEVPPADTRHAALHAPPHTPRFPRQVRAALRAYEVAQMERVHGIVEQSAAQGKMVYEDRDEFMRKQQEAQDSMWGIQFEAL